MYCKAIKSDTVKFVNYECNTIQVNSNIEIQPFSRKSLLLTCNNAVEAFLSFLYFHGLDEKESIAQNIESVVFKHASTCHSSSGANIDTSIVIRYVSVRAAKHALKKFPEFYAKNIYDQKSEYENIIQTIVFANSVKKLNVEIKYGYGV